MDTQSLRAKELSFLFLLILLVNNCATTHLVKTESDYEPVSPLKLRLGCSVDLPKDRFEPKITLNLTTEKLYQKKVTEHYKTSYQWRNRLALVGFGGLCVWAAIKWWDYAVEDTSGKWYPARVFGLLGAGFSFLGAMVGADEFPSSPKYWKKETVIGSDTVYKDKQPLSKKTVSVFTPIETKGYPLQTDEKGITLLDIRDFYTSTPGDSNLILKIDYEGITTKTLIPNNFVNQVRDYENEAENLFTRAQNKEEQGKYEDALADYNLIKEKYPLARASAPANAKIEAIQRKLAEKKIAEIRKRLQRVSAQKVGSAILKFGLDESQANALAIAIENLSQSGAIAVMKEGLGMPLSDNECVEEYRKLNRFQKFYAVVCYKEYLSKDIDERSSTSVKSGYFGSYDEAWESIYEGIVSELSGMLGISYDLASALTTIVSAKLLK
ncbi:MAG: hypothetical protein ABIL70_08155 [candidate division WOR-3 bacterium]